MTQVADFRVSCTRSEALERFERLLEQYAPILRSVIARHCPAELGIQTCDIEQEAILRIWQTVEREKDLREPAAYIYRIAVNATVDAVRRVLARREEQLPDQEGDPEGGGSPGDVLAARPSDAPDAVAERGELVAIIRAAMATLGENRRRALELYLQGLSLAEIAALLGWTEGKARNLVYRGRESLRDALRRSGIDYQG